MHCNPPTGASSCSTYSFELLMQHSGDWVIYFDLILRNLRHHVIDSNHALKRSKMQKESQACANRTCTCLRTLIITWLHLCTGLDVNDGHCLGEISKTNLDYVQKALKDVAVPNFYSEESKELYPLAPATTAWVMPLTFIEVTTSCMVTAGLTVSLGALRSSELTLSLNHHGCSSDVSLASMKLCSIIQSSFRNFVLEWAPRVSYMYRYWYFHYIYLHAVLGGKQYCAARPRPASFSSWESMFAIHVVCTCSLHTVHVIAVYLHVVSDGIR